MKGHELLDINLAGHRALVTGASGGIGAAAVETLRAAGAFTIGMDIVPPDGGSKADEYIQGDITDPRARARALKMLGPAGGRSILVNNAGLVLDKTISDTSEDENRRLLEVNLIAPMLLTREFADAGHRGSIVNVASILAFSGERFTGSYAVTKAAIANFTRAAALEYGGQLRVNAVCPGSIRTPMVTRGWEATGDATNAERRVSSLYPVGRVGEPREIASVIAFLCCDLASFVHGALWTVDGGLLAANAEWGLERL